ncbi:MAG TPA: efflux RND transporter periplasmic adaptor subunit [Gemmatimonadaceae bacterium]
MAAALLCAACGKDPANADAAQLKQGDGANARGGATKDPASAASAASARADNGGGGANGQKTQPTITLASSDVDVVKRANLEEGVAVTGDLRPIESVTIRARLEGDLVAVNVREGQHVNAGELLAKFEDTEQSSGLASAKADKLSAQSDLTTAQWNLDQTAELFKAGAVAERDLKLAQQTVASASARLAAADAKVRSSSSTLSDTRVIAPTTGVIEDRSVENGEHIARGATMFTLVRTNVLELAAAVPARFSGVVRVGLPVLFGAEGRSFSGKVARVSPTVDPTTRSVTVYVQIPNETDALKGGTFAAGRIVSRMIQNALVVPMSAIRLTGDGQQYVYRLSGKAIDIANVKVGATDERAGVTEVLSGLSDGDRIIVGNVGTVGRGMQVIIAGEESRPGKRSPGP